PFLFFYHAPPTTATYPLSLHDALPICGTRRGRGHRRAAVPCLAHAERADRRARGDLCGDRRAHGAAAAPHWIGERDRAARADPRSEEHTSELQSRFDLVCRLLLEKKKK